MKIKSVQLTFADRKYLIYDDGKIWSEYSNDYIKGKSISSDNERKVIDIKVNGKRESLLINRLVFFFFYYNPRILKKDYPTMNHFKQMPLVYHANGDILDNSIQNLKSMLTRSMLSIEIYQKFPEKFTQREGVSQIQEDRAAYCIKELKKGTSYSKISTTLNTSDMSVYRFAKSHNLIGKRSNGTPKLTHRQVLYIRKTTLTGKALALKYRVTETLISRVRTNKTYLSALDK